jgi:hypothetical protein
MSTAFDANGRYRGAVTSRPMPVRDEALEALPRPIREELALVWLTRAAMERRVADSFAVVRDALERQRAAPELIALAARSIDDEYRHAELSRVVASRYAGRELPAPAMLELQIPALEGASEGTRDTLLVLGQCILNETTAAVYLELCAHHAVSTTAQWGIRELLADEIDHGRIGWAHLASRSPAQKAELASWLLPMAFLNLRVWRRETSEQSYEDPVFARHGAPLRSAVEKALVGALREIIVPGLTRAGLKTGELIAWLHNDGGSPAPTNEPPLRFSKVLAASAFHVKDLSL